MPIKESYKSHPPTNNPNGYSWYESDDTNWNATSVKLMEQASRSCESWVTEIEPNGYVETELPVYIPNKQLLQIEKSIKIFKKYRCLTHFPTQHFHKFKHDNEFHAFWYSSSNSLHVPLFDYYEKVSNAKWILALENNWDDEGALPINNQIFSTATDLIGKYITELFEVTSFVLPSPSINPVSNGSLDFEWSLENARLLINFRVIEGHIRGSYYGDLYNNLLPIKGIVEIDKVYEHLLTWMKNLIVR